MHLHINLKATEIWMEHEIGWFILRLKFDFDVTDLMEYI